ncbi:uncharacterized protein LOC124159458 isoform X2 [Ischnura elegans]|nr:uncharacterized protein LOC124159458 isoform X2 [Ischnura elegans]
MGKFAVCRGKSTDSQSKIEHTVKCTLCGEILSCSSENTSPLVDHLRKNHPNVQVARFPELKPGEESEEQNKLKTMKNEDKDTCSQTGQPNADDLASGDHQKDGASQKKYKKLYETTVEVWQCSQGSVICQNCGQFQKPVQKVSKKSLSESSAAAVCFLGCWPLCFLPYMMFGGNSENATNTYCSKCGHLIPPKTITDTKKE